MQINVNTTITILLLLTPNLLLAENTYTIEGDLLKTTFGDYKREVEKQNVCGKLPTMLSNKVNGSWKSEKDGSYTQYTLSDKEYTELVGDAPAFGVAGLSEIYVRELKYPIDSSEYFDTSLSGIINSSRAYTGKLLDEVYNFPIICGDREGMMAKEEEKRLRLLPTVDNYKRLLTELQDSSITISKDLLYYNFFVTFNQVYSDQCGDTIQDKVVRKTTYQDVNGYGDKVGIATTSVLILGSGYVDAFDRYKHLRKANSFKPSMNGLSSIDSMNATLSQLTAPINFLDNFVATQGCSSNKVETVYKRLYKLEN